MFLLTDNLCAQAPDTLWVKTFGGTNNDISYSVQQISDDGYIIVGKTRSFGGGDYDVYLIKTDSTGDTIWTKTYGEMTGEGGNSVQQSTDGAYIIAGYKVINNDFYVYLVKTKPDIGGIEENEFSQEFFLLSQVQPTFFNKKILIKYELLKSCNVHIVIYNLLGRKVRKIVGEKENTGIYTMAWDGRDGIGRRVPIGVFFYRLEIDNFSQTRKFVLIR